MKASWNWLTDYVDVKAPAAEVAERLTMAGLTVENLEETPDDIILEVEITSNRPDWLCHLGIAREIAALYGLHARVPEVKLPRGEKAVAGEAGLEIRDLDLCPYYTGRVIKGVRVAPSPSWLRAKIEAVGLRSVNNVVDATNYVMYECGQPLHAFDLARLGGRKIIVRRAAAGEAITLIDGSKHTLKTSDLVIADARKPVALAGIMGGLESEIGDDTVDILLESAKFDQYSIRVTSKRLGLGSDASYRFERGIDLDGVDWASRRCVQVIVDVAGGMPAEGVLAVGQGAEKPRTVTLRTGRIADILGVSVPVEDARAILLSLGFGVEGGPPEKTVVRVPSFRGDVREEIDLIEEVARIYGYDRIPVETGLKIDVGRKTDRERVVEAVEEVMTASGFYGCVSFSLVSGELFKKYSPWTDQPPVYIENRAGQENAFLRTSLVPSLLGVRKTNEDHKVPRAEVFEVAHVYLPSDDVLPHQPLMAAMVADDDFARLKGTFEKVLAEVGAQDAVFDPASKDFLADGAAAAIALNGREIGYVGRLKEDLRREVDLRESVCVGEVDLSRFIATPAGTKTYKPLARFPGVERDIAVIVDESVRWADLARAVRGSSAENLESVEFASLYRGKPIDEGKKSLAFHLVFRSSERTLTGDEADAGTAAIVDALRERFGARLR